MKHYAGIDVSLNSSSVCVVDESGKIVREVKVPSEPVALIHIVEASGGAFWAHAEEVSVRRNRHQRSD